MSRDIKHRVPAFRQPKPRRVTARAGLALIAGFLFVAILAAGYQRFGAWGVDLQAPLAGIPAPPPEPEFSFFKVLPGREQQIAESDINAQKREARIGKRPREGLYFLQIGAFTRQDQAQELKQRLETLARLKPHLEQINLEYATWYRVQLGPYRTILDADRVRAFLRDQDIDSIMQTLPEPRQNAAARTGPPD